MELNETSIRVLVEEIVKNIGVGGVLEGKSILSETGGLYKGAFGSVNEAVKAAISAHESLMKLSLETRKEIIAAMRRAALDKVEELAKMAVEETGMGRVADKIEKNRLAATKTPGVEDIEAAAFSDDNGLTLVERAPYGVIGAIAPSTNPTETIINNCISMIAGGNSVVFNAHPSAKNVTLYTISLLNEAIEKAGGPSNLISTMLNPTIETAKELMRHPDIKLLVVTGGPAVVKEALKSDKKVIAAGPGNPPVVVDETADIPKAAKDIVNGAGLDNNIVCICEKEIIAVSSIADALKTHMRENGAYELNETQTKMVTELVIKDPGGPGHEGAPNKEYVGKDAAYIAKKAGITVPEDTRILLCEVSRDHPLVWTEQLMPVIPLVRVNNVDEAIELAVACEHGFRHTAVMHSKNIENLSRMAKVMNCSLFVKNGSSYNGMGLGGAGFTSYTIASPTGEGFTRARTFTRERRCSLIGYFRIV